MYSDAMDIVDSLVATSHQDINLDDMLISNTIEIETFRNNDEPKWAATTHVT